MTELTKRVLTGGVLLSLFVVPSQLAASFIFIGLITELVLWRKILHKGLIVAGVLYTLPILFNIDFVKPMLGMAFFIDTVAFIGGKYFGGKKLTPAVSPGKTVAGVICAFVACLIAVLLQPPFVRLKRLLTVPLSHPDWTLAGGVVLFASLVSLLIYRFRFYSTPYVIAGLALSMTRVRGGILDACPVVSFVYFVVIIATAADLLISKVKRAYGVKDTSSLLPGHGGFWDRFDSFAGLSAALLLIRVLASLITLFYSSIGL